MRCRCRVHQNDPRRKEQREHHTDPTHLPDQSGAVRHFVLGNACARRRRAGQQPGRFKSATYLKRRAMPRNTVWVIASAIMDIPRRTRNVPGTAQAAAARTPQCKVLHCKPTSCASFRRVRRCCAAQPAPDVTIRCGEQAHADEHRSDNDDRRSRWHFPGQPASHREAGGACSSAASTITPSLSVHWRAATAGAIKSELMRIAPTGLPGH